MYEPTANEDDYKKGWEDAIDTAIEILDKHRDSLYTIHTELMEARG